MTEFIKDIVKQNSTTRQKRERERDDGEKISN